MKIQLIIIGNELLNGKIQDLNTHWFANFCFKNNYDLIGVELIRDNKEDFIKALDKATAIADYVFTTGGLGPTQDDLTKAMMSEYFQKQIQYNEDAYKITLSHYERGNRKFNPEKVKYPNIPQDFKALYNPAGYAPGLMFEFAPDKFIFNTPGVPSEFQGMVNESITPFLKKSGLFQKHVIIKTWKLPEANIFNKLAPELWAKLERLGEVSSLPHLLGVDIGVKIDSPEKEQLVIDTVNASALKEYIWHIGPEKLEEVIINKALAKNLKIGFAESCTGGLCASRITDIGGCSSVFWGSIVSYSNEVKMNCLGVKEQTLINHGAVSLQTAKEMAQGALKNMNLDIAITTTGIAGPGGGSEEKPVGTVGIGVATKHNATSEMYQFKGNREQLKFRFSQVALYKLLETIMEF